MGRKPKIKRQEVQYQMFLSCSAEDLEGWYNAYVTGYPRHVAAMVRALATARGFDTTAWKEFCE